MPLFSWLSVNGLTDIAARNGNASADAPPAAGRSDAALGVVPLGVMLPDVALLADVSLGVMLPGVALLADVPLGAVLPNVAPLPEVQPTAATRLEQIIIIINHRPLVHLLRLTPCSPSRCTDRRKLSRIMLLPFTPAV